MLSISKPIKTAAQGEYYLLLASTDDYYLDGEEPAGFWLGKGAGHFGLAGILEKDEFRNLLRGRSPDGGKALVRNADSIRRAGWDLTWSAPKSVSVVWSQAGRDVRTAIQGCLRRAVGFGIEYLESVGVVSRAGEKGVRREPADLIFACFPHTTSRAQDPQLHVHSILLNVGVRPDGSTGTLEPREIFRHQMVAGALFRAELAHQLETTLGLRARREGKSFELFGVPKDIIDHFSKRRFEIVEAMARLNLTGAKAAEVVALDTRSRKEPVTRELLDFCWTEIGKEFAFTTGHVAFLLNAPFPQRDPVNEAREVSGAALTAVTQTESHFPARKLTQTLAEEAQGRGTSGSDVLLLSSHLRQSSQLTPIGIHRGEDQWTTPEMLAVEKRLLELAEILHSRRQVNPDANPILSELVERHSFLSAEQQAALGEVCGVSGGLSLVRGLAGTGKSTLFRVANEAWTAMGFKVHGTALSGKAAVELEVASGIPSRTLHSFLHALRRTKITLDSRSVVLVDEAAMVGTRQLENLFRHAAASGATVILCGDERQVQSVEAGGGYARLVLTFGAAELCEIRRQSEEWARGAVLDFSRGNSREALSAYQSRDLVTEAPDEESAKLSLMRDWIQRDQNNSNAVVLAGTNPEVSDLNTMAQIARLTNQPRSPAGIKMAGEPIFPGDRVLFTRNSTTLSVMNGELGTVVSICSAGITVKTDRGAELVVDPEQYPHLRLGYAMTAHKAQGATFDTAYVLTGSMQNRELTYVEASRARNETRWYLGDTFEENVQRMATSHQKKMAHDLVEGPTIELELKR